MIQNRRLKIALMTGIAGGRKSLKLPHGGILVTCVALHQGVCADQRKPILMVANRVDGNLPTFYAVALFAIGAELAAMNVRMAVGAAGTYIFEHQAQVALSAPYIRVHSAQGILRLVVVEFRKAANRLPAGKGMAVLAGSSQPPMRTPHRCMRSCGRLLRRIGRRQQRSDRHDQCEKASRHLNLIPRMPVEGTQRRECMHAAKLTAEGSPWPPW